MVRSTTVSSNRYVPSSESPSTFVSRQPCFAKESLAPPGPRSLPHPHLPTGPKLAELRDIQAEAPEFGATNLFALNHGNALSLYFADPEGNTVEVYFDTPYYVAQPRGDPLDLNKTDAEIMGETLTNCRADSTFMLAEDWRRRFAEAQVADASAVSR